MPILKDRDDLAICGDFGQEAFTAFCSSKPEDNIASTAEKLLSLANDESKVNRMILGICVNVLGILRFSDNKYGFVHQHIRDFFAAVKNVNTMCLSVYMFEEGEKELALESMNRVFRDEPVSLSVRRFMGEYLGEHKNKPYFGDGKWNYGVPEEKSDRNLLKRLLDLYRGRFDVEKTDGYALYSLIQVLKEIRSDLSGGDFSELDLKRCSFNGVILAHPAISACFYGTLMNENTFLSTGHADIINFTAFSPDGRVIVTACKNGTAKLWDVETCQEIISLTGHKKTVYSAVFNSRSDLVLTASMDGTAKLWDVKTGRCLGTLFGHKEGVKYAIFSPDSKMVITASFDKTAIIWDTKTCREICCIKGHRDSVDFACFSPNGEFAVSHSHNVIKLWRVSSFCEIGTILGYNISRTPLCFSSDSKKLITIGDDDTVSIWDVNSCERIFDLDCQAEGVTFASFCKDEDEKMVLIASDVDLKVWDVVNRREICRLQNSTHFSYFDYAELY